MAHFTPKKENEPYRIHELISRSIKDFNIRGWQGGYTPLIPVFRSKGS